MKKFKLIGAAFALSLSLTGTAFAADACKGMECCKDGADCCKDGGQDCCTGKAGSDCREAGKDKHDMSSMKGHDMGAMKTK